MELVYTTVLEAVSERIESSSLSGGTKFGDVGKLVTPADCKSAATGIVGSKPTVSTKLSRIREEVSQESHKLQSVVRVHHPQPNLFLDSSVGRVPDC